MGSLGLGYKTSWKVELLLCYAFLEWLLKRGFLKVFFCCKLIACGFHGSHIKMSPLWFPLIISLRVPLCFFSYLKHTKINRNAGEEVVRAINAPGLSDRRLGVQIRAVLRIPSQISCICLFSTGHWQPLIPVGVMVFLCMSSVIYWDWVVYLPIWALTVKKINTPRAGGSWRKVWWHCRICQQPGRWQGTAKGTRPHFLPSPGTPSMQVMWNLSNPSCLCRNGTVSQISLTRKRAQEKVWFWCVSPAMGFSFLSSSLLIRYLPSQKLLPQPSFSSMQFHSSPHSLLPSSHRFVVIIFNI